ncbi:probable WRKY transcription factor 30 [Prosopis cineraria]|uniref:probable WRKY transcription factor 30 n=1 Tax=Prosopis cineraria TaxID=364024 RepID=UPI00240F7E2E|nr:probable WRKY transcription factor 30 [Prosopis cineraria]
MADLGATSLLTELLQGRDLARHLQMCLHEPSTSPETRDTLIRHIIAAFDKALAFLNSGASPPFSPPCDDLHLQHQHASPTKWTKHIKISPGMAVESLLDDGFSWRKYGQKDILGAKFPRGYYRCTHRHAQGCLATKQVQRSDQDPATMEVNYRGTHTCKLASAATPPSPEQLVNLRAGLKVLTDNLNASDQTSFASFPLPSTSGTKPDNPPSVCPAIENNAVETFSSPPYMSPATSATAHFSVSPTGLHGFGGRLSLPASAPDLKDAVFPSSAPTVASELPFDPFEFEGHDFTFHDPRYF